MIEGEHIDYTSSEWLSSLTLYQVGDYVVMPNKHGDQVLIVSKIRPVRSGDLPFAQHSQYVELSDRFGIVESNVSAAQIKLVK